MNQISNTTHRCICITILTVIFPLWVMSQNLTQTVRGTIYDSDNKFPLFGATVVMPGTEPLNATTSDKDGNFRLENVPVGRVTLQLNYIGYEGKTIPNIVINSGKEVILDIYLQESVIAIDEVVFRAFKNKGEAINEMSLLSARSISLEQTNRFAGAFNDPSRILTNFAGVTTHNGNNIIVRGNAPKYVQWRLEGVEITNPSHFDDQNSSSPGMNALNNNLLATSDFYTGAFSPEYGNALSSIYDIRLRAGNNEKFESTFGFGIIGTDFTIEGPFKKGYAGSYIVNYRYSTAALISNLGIVDFGGIPKYQDATYKILLPSKKLGTISIFGLWGLSGFLFEDVTPDFFPTPGDRSMNADIIEDFRKKNYLFNSGITHTMPINKNSYIKTNLSYSMDGSDDGLYESKIIEIGSNENGPILDTVNRTMNYSSKLDKFVFRGAMTYSSKLNAKNKIEAGVNYSLFNFNHNQSILSDDDLTTRVTLIDFDRNIGVLQSFISWKHRVNQNIGIVTGVHNVNVLFNNKTTVEPRIAMRWALNNKASVHAGYGKHSSMERIHNYFAKVPLETGIIVEPNHDLDLLKAHHFVVGYERRFNENLMAKIEVYYQSLYSLPVENNDTSYYATINEGVEYRYVDLVNAGNGHNYGGELTLERFFATSYYFLINGSLFDSKYKTLEGVLRNSGYNSNYLVNVLFGKEFINLGRKDNQVLSLNARFFYSGGMRIIPLIRDEQGNINVDPANNKYWDYSKVYEDRLDDIYFITISASYKWNRPGTTHEVFLSIENITNNRAKLSEYYDSGKPDLIGYRTQTSLFPNFLYRVYF